MGDERHKRPPPKGEFRRVTPLFIKQVEAQLLANDVHNTKLGLKKGQRGYLPASHQDLADETGATPNAIMHLLGRAKGGASTKPVKQSKLVDPICALLGIERIVSAEIPASMAELVQRIAALSQEARDEIAADVRKKQQR